jgi:hypothetical protein
MLARLVVKFFYWMPLLEIQNVFIFIFAELYSMLARLVVGFLLDATGGN